MSKRTPTSPANLFAAGKSYAFAMGELLPSINQASAAAVMPFMLLGGFSLELTLKAIILRVNQDEAELQALGHRLADIYTRAKSCGLHVVNEHEVRRLIDRVGPSHAGLTFRYIPDVERIDMIGPGLFMELLLPLIRQIETDFDVWQDDLEAEQ